MPAEWAPHSATWLTWPVNRITWPGKRLKQVENIYVQMLQALLLNEKVNLLVHDKKTAAKVLALLSKSLPTNNLIFHEVPAVDTWIRDYGPIFIKRGREKAFTKWIFNGWGGKYADLARDNGVVDRISSLKRVKRFDVPLIMEGGSIDMNGEGTCLTTEQCLLNSNRNKAMTRTSLENYLQEYLGVRKVIWLKEGIEADDTDGHVDDITRFVNKRTIVTAVESDKKDKNHHYLAENLEILKSATDQDGRPLTIVELPMPGVVGPGRSDTKHKRLPASYANFYIANGVVLVPVYSHRNDKIALKILQDLFPGRRVLGIECSPLVYGLGSIHCVTQQEPV